MSDFSAVVQRLDSRLDSKYAAFLERQLEFVKTQTYDIKYPALKARLFIPVSAQVPTGAASHLYRQWDEYGKARVISNYGDDFPRVGTGVKEFSGTIKSIGASYSYSVEDLRRSAFAGTQLDSRLARSARNAIEFELDELAAFGHKESNLLGFLNNPFVPIEQGKPWFGTQNKTSRQIMDDLAELVTKMVETTNELHAPDTILLPIKHFAYIAQTPVSDKSETTILKAFLANSPYITGIDSWQKLNGRAVAYKRSPEILELEIPQEFEQFPPQPRNMEFVINCHAKFAGVTIYYPKAVRYLEGI
jgi:hypothetical protein